MHRGRGQDQGQVVESSTIMGYVLAMGIFRLNHAVLYVRNLDETVQFYTQVLGFRPVGMTPEGFRGAAFLRAPGSTNDHDLGLFEMGAAAGPSGAGRTTVGLYHLAWEVDTLNELERVAEALTKADALVGSSDHGTTKSLYGRDPNGIEFEIVWLIPAELLDDDALEARKRIGHLDLEKEKARYGATTEGGIGISRVAVS
jgi:catechol-2,3-dioxygenase